MINLLDAGRNHEPLMHLSIRERNAGSSIEQSNVRISVKKRVLHNSPIFLTECPRKPMCLFRIIRFDHASEHIKSVPASAARPHQAKIASPVLPRPQTQTHGAKIRNPLIRFIRIKLSLNADAERTRIIRCSIRTISIHDIHILEFRHKAMEATAQARAYSLVLRWEQNKESSCA